MANISSAFGQVTINATQPVKNALIDAIKLTESWEYAIFIEEDGSFTGNGRWSMSATLENLMRNLSYVLITSDNIDPYITKTGISKSEIDLMVKTIIENDWEIHFEYIDEESGMQFIVGEEVLIKHTANNPMDKVSITTNLINNYGWSWKSLVDHCGYSVNDIIEWYDDEYLLERIEDEAPAFSLTVDEFIKKFGLEDRLNKE